MRAWFNRLGERQLRRLFEIQRCDIRGQNPQWMKERLEQLDRLEAMLDEAAARAGSFGVKDLAVGGRELIELGYVPGRELGEALRELARLAGEGELENSPQALLEAARFLPGAATGAALLPGAAGGRAFFAVEAVQPAHTTQTEEESI